MMRAPPFSGSYPGSSALPQLSYERRLDVDKGPYGVTGSWIMARSPFPKEGTGSSSSGPWPN